jgi:hypothetical protein
MKTIAHNWNLHTVSKREDRINPQPQYQRTGVWSDKNNQLLIDTILRGYDIPKIYLTNSSDSNFEHEVIDGQQRLKAIWGFYNNEYALGEESKDLSIGDFVGKKYNELPNDISDDLDLYQLSIIIIEDTDDEEIRDLFLRLQEGKSLNPPEKRNAMTGDMRDFIKELTQHKTMRTIIPKNDIRFMYADWIAHIVCLELEGGATNIKAQDLKKMYENNKSFDKESDKANRVKKILNFIYRSFESKKIPELNIKWGFVDFYLLVSLLINEYILKGKEIDFSSFYIGFEKERRSVEDEAELIEAGDSWSKDLFDYMTAFKQSGGIRSNIETRNQVYTRKLFKEIIDLNHKDTQRLFDKNQRIVIWRRDNEECKQCECKVEFSDMQADHIIPHAKGGKTTIENGQTLCASCNQSKGSK